MSGVRIESAYYGNETWTKDVTDSLMKKVSGGVLNVVVEPSIVPTFEAAPVAELNDGDKKRIEENVVKACGGTADQACIERTRVTLTDQELRSKMPPIQPNTAMKGTRLTVTILDGKQRRTLVTPEGQVFRLENVLGDVKSATELPIPTPSKIQELALTLAGSVLGAFVWAVSILSVWTIFMNLYTVTGRAIFKWQAYIFTAVATLFPGSGLVIIFVNWFFPAFFKEYVAN